MDDSVEIRLLQHSKLFIREEPLTLGDRVRLRDIRTTNEEPLESSESPPSSNPERDAEILMLLKNRAERDGLTYESNSRTYKQPGMSSLTTLLTDDIIRIAGSYAMYAGGAAAGIAVFLRNVLGVITEWEKLRPRRSVEIVVRGEKVTIKEGADVDDVIEAIAKALANKPTP
ncbi:MAG TPA: hypothetical protein VMT72_04310 [Pseudolabrys sp.]|nr:hypothetical protein [Pseudolabrys sp.]